MTGSQPDDVPRGWLARIAAVAVRRPWRVVLVAAALAALAAVPASTVLLSLGTAGYFAPGDDSAKANRVLERYFPQGPPNLVLLVSTPSGVDDAAAVRAGQALTERVSGTGGIGPATSYWNSHDPALRSGDGSMALILARLTGDEDAVKTAMRRVYPLFSGTHDGLRVQVGGQPAAERELQELSREGLTRSELIAAPLVFLLLLLVFGSAVAAALPTGIGFLAVVGTLATLRLWSAVTDVSIFSLNLATALGLGLGIDYSLFILARYREEMAQGRERGAAIQTAVRTAGRTVAYSAVTVAVGLAAMALFPLYYLRSFTYAGIAVVLTAAIAAIVVLPAVLTLLGPRVDTFDIRFWRGGGRHRRGIWRRVAELVLRRPVLVALGAVGLLLVLGTPFLRAEFQLPDDRLLPASSEAHQVADTTRTQFDGESRDAIYITAQGLPGDPVAAGTVLGDYALAISRLPDVAAVVTAPGRYAAGNRIGDTPAPAAFTNAGQEVGWISVLPSTDQYSPGAERLVRAIRALDPPFTARVGGNSAHLVDTKATLATYLPWVLTTMVVAILILLFLFTGSVLIPVKAVVCNLLSLTATFGALVWVFQEGHLAGLLGGFQVSGALEIFTPILMLCLTFSLSMDYEVFLISRIHEAHQAGESDAAAVTTGLRRTGPLVTSAAALLIVVLLANVASRLTILKMLGLGASLAILMDATVVRAALVPAVMRLAGPANWWAPGPLRRLHNRFGLSETAAGTGAAETAGADSGAVMSGTDGSGVAGVEKFSTETSSSDGPGADQAGTEKVGSEQVGAGKVGVGKARSGKAGSGKVGAGKAGMAGTSDKGSAGFPGSGTKYVGSAPVPLANLGVPLPAGQRAAGRPRTLAELPPEREMAPVGVAAAPPALSREV